MTKRTYNDTTDHSPFMAGGFLVVTRPGEKLPRYPVNRKVLAKCARFKVGDRVKHTVSELSGQVLEVLSPPHAAVLEAATKGGVSVSDPSDVYGKFLVKFDGVYPDAAVHGEYLR
jgi:hypothetical protein